MDAERDIHNLKVQVNRILAALEWPSPYLGIDEFIDMAERNIKKWVMIHAMLKKIKAIEQKLHPEEAYRKVYLDRADIIPR